MSTKRVLFVSSSGGHWVQLMRLATHLQQYDRFFICTEPGYADQVSPSQFYSVPDATRWNKLRLIHQALRVLIIFIRVWPDVVISTGAAPGFFALFFGNIFGKKTIWIDSFANVDEMSLSGKRVKNYANLWLTQHKEVSVRGGQDGPSFFGSLL